MAEREHLRPMWEAVGMMTVNFGGLELARVREGRWPQLEAR